MTNYEIIKTIVDVARCAANEQQAYTDVEMLLKGGNIVISIHRYEEGRFTRSVEYVTKEELHSFASMIALDVMQKIKYEALKSGEFGKI